MPRRIRTLFIGNRPAIFQSLIRNENIELVEVLATDKSLLDIDDYAGGISLLAASGEKQKVVNALMNCDYELLVSAGCPYVLPVEKCSEEKICINSHPSVLPLGRGKHPINECLLSGHKVAGSTLHYLSRELDEGDIIHQKSFELSEDIDLDILYSFIFDFEREVFEEGLQKLIDTNFDFRGSPQTGASSYYSRQDADMVFDVRTGDIDDLLLKTRAFSSRNLGIRVSLGNTRIRVHKASRIRNRFLQERYRHCEPGSVAINRESVLIVKMQDGLVRFDAWRRDTDFDSL